MKRKSKVQKELKDLKKKVSKEQKSLIKKVEKAVPKKKSGILDKDFVKKFNKKQSKIDSLKGKIKDIKKGLK